MLEPDVSIIIPVHNLKNYVARTIDSVLNQTFQAIEIIVVDDHSRDGTYDELLALQKKDQRLQVYQLPKHAGVSKARNFGLAKAKGEYVVFVDGDDRLQPEFIETLFYGMNEEVAMSIVGYCRGVWNMKLQKGTRNYKVMDRKKVFKSVNTFGDPIGGYVWNKMFRKAVLDELDLTFDEHLNLAEDLLFTAKYIAKSPQTKFVFEPSYLYQKVNRPDSTIHRATTEMREKEQEIRAQIDEIGKNISNVLKGHE